MWKLGNTALYGPMLAPVSSVNSSIWPTPGAVTLTSDDAALSTLMNVLTSKALPPQVEARVVCCFSSTIEGGLVTVVPCCATIADWVPAAASAHTLHDSARTPSKTFDPAATVRKRYSLEATRAPSDGAQRI